jgi:hypothetical protein
MRGSQTRAKGNKNYELVSALHESLEFVGLSRRICFARLTGEWHNVAILDFVGHRCLAIRIPTRDGSWVASSRAPSEE